MMRRLLALLAACSLSGPAAAHAEALTGDVTIAGDHAGYVPITVAGSFDPFGGHGSLGDRLEVRGAGPYVGFALVSDKARQSGDHYLYLGFRSGDSGSFMGQMDENGKLPAGQYRLYLLMTTGHTTVRIHFPGLPGSSTVQPSVFTPMEVASLAERPAMGSPATYVYGRSSQLKSAGLFVGQWSVAYGGSVGREEECAYMGDMDDSGDQAYGPTCPGGISFYDPIFSTFLPMESVDGVFFAGEVGPGRYGFGGNITFVGEKPKVEASAAWIGFEPLPGSVQPAPVPLPVPLALAVSPRTIHVGRRADVRVTVTAHGRPVESAVVTLGARQTRTNHAGRAHLIFFAHHKGVARVIATRQGMALAKTLLRIR